MVEFTKKEMKASLYNGISLVERGAKFAWTEFHEIEDFYDMGFILVNKQKGEFYERIRKSGKK